MITTDAIGAAFESGAVMGADALAVKVNVDHFVGHCLKQRLRAADVMPGNPDDREFCAADGLANVAFFVRDAELDLVALWQLPTTERRRGPQIFISRAQGVWREGEGHDPR